MFQISALLNGKLKGIWSARAKFEGKFRIFVVYLAHKTCFPTHSAPAFMCSETKLLTSTIVTNTQFTMIVLIETNFSSRCLLCRTCRTAIPEGALQVVMHSAKLGVSVCHLTCWKPNSAVPMQRNWFKFRDMQAQSRKKEVEDWIETWNLQFTPKEDLVPQLYLNKAVNTSETSLRRLLLAVYQYLTPREIDTAVSLACRAWFHISRDEELWRTLFVAEFKPIETEGEGNYRRKYIAYLLGSCWHCKALKPVQEIVRICSIYKRPLCKQCAGQLPCSTMSFSSYMRAHKVSKSVLNCLSIPSFTQNHAKSSYLSTFQSKLQPYAETRRQLLLNTLDTNYPGRLQAEYREKMLAFDLGDFYGSWCALSNTILDWAMVGFCGKGGRREDVISSCEEFLAAIGNKQK